MLFRNTRVYPIQLTNDLGQTMIVQPTALCELPQEIGFRYDSLLEPVYLEAPVEINDVEEGITDEPSYIDETPINEQIKRGRGRPKKV